MADEAQPDEGQGDGGTGLFDSYLQSVPEEHREVVGGYLADAAKNVNTRLEEAATLQKTLGPLSEIEGLSQYKPDDLGQLIAWHQQVGASEDAYKQWLATAAREAELIPPEERTETEDALADLTPAQIREFAKEEIAPLEERVLSFERAQLIDQESQLIKTRVDELEAEHKISLTEEQRQTVLRIADSMASEDEYLHSGKDWVTPGFNLYMQIRAEGANGLVDDKARQPEPAITAGAVAALPVNTDWKTARERGLEKLRQSRAT